jgi:hypothetical protein
MNTERLAQIAAKLDATKTPEEIYGGGSAELTVIEAFVTFISQNSADYNL